MFGKISKRYYKDKNNFGPRILVGTIVFVLIAITIGHFSSYVLKSNIEYEKNEAHAAFNEGLPKGYTYEGIEYLGERTQDPLGYSSMDKHLYRVSGLKDSVGRRYPDGEYLLYTSYEFNMPMFIYIVRVNKKINDFHR